MSVFCPLKANDEVRDATRRPSTRASVLISSSVIPSLKYSWSPAGLRSANGNTARVGGTSVAPAVDAPRVLVLSHMVAAASTASAVPATVALRAADRGRGR